MSAEEDASFFGEAAARWEDIITVDLLGASGQLLNDLGPPPFEGCTYPDFVDGKWSCIIFRA